MMKNLPTPALPAPAPAHHGARFRERSGMSPSEHRTVLAQLATLLTEAAGIAAGERGGDER
jgi:hypothetical protein